MAGNNSIRGDETVTFTDNMSFDGTERGGKMTTDGELWIGSTAAPHVRKGSLSSVDNSVTITTGNGTIDLSTAATTNSGITVIISQQVDMLSTGTTSLFTFANEFNILACSFYGTDVTGSVSVDGVYNVGWTAPNYDDLVLAGNTYATDQSYLSPNIINISTTEYPTIPAGSELFINVTTAESGATTCTQRIDLWGYYTVSGGSGAPGVSSVSGTTNRITSTGGAAPIIDIASTYIGQSSITTLGTVTTGTWNGSTIDVAHGGTGLTIQSAFSAYVSADIANVTGDATNYQVVFDTEVFDQHSDFNNATGLFTAPVTGKYQFNFNIRFEGLAAGNTIGFVELVTSNRTYRFGEINTGAVQSSGILGVSGSALADMDASDTAYINVNVAGATKVVDIGGSAILISSFSGSLVS